MGVTELAIENKVKKVTHTCDNKSSVSAISAPPYSQRQMLAPDADIILACHKLRKECDTEFNLEWVKGHQDDNKEYDELDDEAKLNVDMDTVCKDERVNGTVHKPKPYSGSGAMLIIDGEWVTNDYANRIQEAIMLPRHIKFFLWKYRDMNLTIDDYNRVNWDGLGNARKTMTTTENTRLCKYLNGWLNTGRQKGHFGGVPACPCCGAAEENQLHILQCNDPRSEETRASALRLLEKYYQEKQIPVGIYNPFLKLCRAACNGTTFDTSTPISDIVSTAVSEQQKLGPELFLRGYLVSEWSDAMHAFAKKFPESKLNHLYTGLWRILVESMWENRNTILHGKDNFVDAIERKRLLGELKQWRQQAHVKLGSKQRNLVDFNDSDIERWSISAMKEVLALLIISARNHATKGLANQRSIESFFPPIRADNTLERPPRDDG